jgi:hypothetical protein
MAKKKFDGILNAVHLDENGQIKIARVFERRGPVVSDLILLDRADFIQCIKDGQVFYTGNRILNQGSSFELGTKITIELDNGKDVVVVGKKETSGDNIKSVPRF